MGGVFTLLFFVHRIHQQSVLVHLSDFSGSQGKCYDKRKLASFGCQCLWGEGRVGLECRVQVDCQCVGGGAVLGSCRLSVSMGRRGWAEVL